MEIKIEYRRDPDDGATVANCTVSAPDAIPDALLSLLRYRGGGVATAYSQDREDPELWERYATVTYELHDDERAFTLAELGTRRTQEVG